MSGVGICQFPCQQYVRICRTNVAEKFKRNVTAAEFSMCKSQPLSFTIDHYAGKVISVSVCLRLFSSLLASCVRRIHQL